MSKHRNPNPRLVLAAALALLALLASAPLAAQEVRRWTDADGVVHYTDPSLVPGGVESESVELPESVPTDAKASAEIIERIKRRAAYLEQERLRREREAAAAERARALEDALERNEIIAAPPKKDRDRSNRDRRPPPEQPPDPPQPPPPSFNIPGNN